jgi:hypothetical protein
MTHVQHEWDWPARRHRKHRRYPPTVYLDPPLEFRRTGSRFDVYQPSGWNSPVVKKIVNAYWLITITAIKVMVAVPLTIAMIGAFWFVWIILTL